MTVKWITITPNWAALTSLSRCIKTVSAFDGDTNLQRADMRHTTISGHHHTRHTVPVAYWIVIACWIIAGIVAVIALGGGLTRLAVALALVTTDWWVLSEVVHRFDIRS